MVRTIIEFNNELYNKDDMVTLRKKDSTILTGRIMEFDLDHEHGLWLDMSESYNFKRQWIMFRDIESMSKI